MFKKEIWLVFLCCLFCFLLPVHAQADEEAEPQEKAANLLLLHEENLSEEDLDALRILADTATALGKSVKIETAEKTAGSLESYEMILCYKLDEHAVLASRLLRSGVKLMVMGGTFLPDLAQASGGSLAVQETVWRGKKSVLRYDFSAQARYEALVDMPQPVYRLDAAEYEHGTLEEEELSLAFCSRGGNVWYIPVEKLKEDLVRAALMQEISCALWDYAGMPPKKGQYLVLDQVYPYMPAQELLARVEILVEKKIPFVISVMPLYQNADFPAMQQFCEVLRYAQANQGAVILHAPILRGEVTDTEEFNRQMTTAITNLTDRGVYPLGIDVPYSWTWEEEKLEWMKRSRTVFVYMDTEKTEFSRETSTNLLYYNYHALTLPALALDDGGENCVQQFSGAQRIEAGISPEDLKKRAEAIEKNENSYYNLWDSGQSLWADNFHLSLQNQTLTINDQVCSRNYVPQPYPEQYDYKRNMLKRFTVNIQNESRGLTAMVTIVTVLFLLMIGYARVRQHRNFLIKLDPKEKKKGRKRKGDS